MHWQGDAQPQLCKTFMLLQRAVAKFYRNEFSGTVINISFSVFWGYSRCKQAMMTCYTSQMFRIWALDT